MKKIKTFEAACKKLKIDAEFLPDVSMLPAEHQASIIAYYKLIIIIQALCDGWVPDWSDTDQWKYYAWFEVKADKNRPGGVEFSNSHFHYTLSYTHVGSRLCLPSSELALYAGKQFADLYKDYLLIS